MYHNAGMPDFPAPSLVRVQGVDIHWTEAGSGRPLVLLHGLSDSHATWARVGPRLAATRRVLMPDLPGHGLSARPDASYEIDWHARVIAGWVDALGLDEFDLVGHSYGGGVAQWLLLAMGSRVRRLGLVAAGGLGPDVTWALRLCAIPGLVERFGAPFMGLATRIAMLGLGGSFDRDEIAALAWMNARPGTARAFARTVADVIDLAGQRRHFLDRAHELVDLPPTAVFWGDRDRVVPVTHAEAIGDAASGVRVMRFAGVGHFPHRERPDEFARALEAFVDEPAPRAALVRRTSIVVPGRRRSLWRRAIDTIRGWVGRRPPSLPRATATS